MGSDVSSKELDETLHEDFLNTFTLDKVFRLLTLRKAIIIWSIDIKNFLLRWLSGIIVPKDINIKRMMLPSNEIATKLQPSQVSRAASEYQASQKSRVKESSASYRFVEVGCHIDTNRYLHLQMLDDAEFWISCKRLKALRKASQWQLIKCSAPSTICWCQCDIRIGCIWGLCMILHILILNAKMFRTFSWIIFYKQITGRETFLEARYSWTAPLLYKGCFQVSFILRSS